VIYEGIARPVAPPPGRSRRVRPLPSPAGVLPRDIPREKAERNQVLTQSAARAFKRDASVWRQSLMRSAPHGFAGGSGLEGWRKHPAALRLALTLLLTRASERNRVRLGRAPLARAPPRLSAPEPRRVQARSAIRCGRVGRSGILGARAPGAVIGTVGASDCAVCCASIAFARRLALVASPPARAAKMIVVALRVRSL
jgi:hypothetical protein